LIETAIHRKREPRERARALLEEANPFDTLEPWVQHSIKLRTATTCSERKAEVLAIRKPGDFRALPAIKHFRFNGRKACRGYTGRGCMKCMKKDLYRTHAIRQTTANKANKEAKKKGK